MAATVAFAGSGLRAVFSLGETNTVDAQSALQGATPANQLLVQNTSAGSTAVGVSIPRPPPLAPRAGLEPATFRLTAGPQRVGGGTVWLNQAISGCLRAPEI